MASQASVDWKAWHASYQDPDSELGRRLALVQDQLRAALDRAPVGPIQMISVCAGQGHDAIGVLVDHPRRADVSARLVELDAQNVQLAQGAARAAGLDAVEAISADASLTDSYAGAVPADVVLVCGVFGNLSAADIAKTIDQLGQLCAPGATVIWTRHRRPPDLVPHIRETFEHAGFEEVAFEEASPFGVGTNRLTVAPRPLRPGVKMFDFIGYEALWPHLSASERAALGPLFRLESSPLELVEAVRAIPYGLPSGRTVESMLLEARGTSAAKHLFLAQVLAKRHPHTQPALVHRVYRLDRDHARELFGAAIAKTVPDEGFTDVHRYLTIVVDGIRISVDATVPGPPWDGRTPIEPVCGSGQDFPVGLDPDGEMAALEGEHCDTTARAAFLAALGAVNAPPRV
ncbi:MAG: class I SAM-dependent methyltransferase [Solirubrobacteraceae bacterium]